MIHARDLFEAWQMVKESGVDPFASDAAKRMPLVPGWSGLGMPDDTVQPAPSTLQAIRAIQLAVADTARRAHRVELIATTLLGGSVCYHPGRAQGSAQISET